MNLEFGEIVEPSSRAFWDDYDELEENKTFKMPEWRWLNENNDEEYPDKRELFVVIEGEQITDFINTAVLKNKLPLCQIKDGKVSVYDLPEANLTICVSEEKDLNYFGPITELLIPFIKNTEKAVGVTIQPSVMHKGTNPMDANKVCFLRGINSEIEGIQGLREPNLISGISAGVASWRKFANLSFSSYLIYMDTPGFDSTSTKPILELFHKIGIPSDDKYVLKFKTASNLYM